MIRAASSPSLSVAPVHCATSPSVGAAASGKKLIFAKARCLFQVRKGAPGTLARRNAIGGFTRLELRAASEVERLKLVVFALGDRIGVVDADRPERRSPDQARADRRADRALVVDIDAVTLNVGRWSTAPRHWAGARRIAGPAGRVRRQAVERGEIRLPLVAEQR